MANKYLLKSDSVIYIPASTEVTPTSLDPTQISAHDFETYGVDSSSFVIGEHEGEFPMSEIGTTGGMKILGYKIFGFEDVESLSIVESKEE